MGREWFKNRAFDESSAASKFQKRAMSTRPKTNPSSIVHQPAAQFYNRFVEGIKQRIRTAQVKAALAANAELVLHYWEIGRDILASQEHEGWGAKVIDRLAGDLQREFPKLSGYSARNLKYMRAWIRPRSGSFFAEERTKQSLSTLSATRKVRSASPNTGSCRRNSRINCRKQSSSGNWSLRPENEINQSHPASTFRSHVSRLDLTSPFVAPAKSNTKLLRH